MRFEQDVVPGHVPVRTGVRHYTVFNADVGRSTIARATPVRPQQFLQLVLGGEHRLRNLEAGRFVQSRKAALIGLCTYRKYNLMISGKLRLFYVQFQPGALHAWTGLDMSALTDNCMDAREAFGAAVDDLADQLAATGDAAEQVAIADAFFAALPEPNLDGVAAMGRAIRDGSPFDVDLGPSGGLSARQFQRRFARQIGVTPKLYARLCRLAAVIDLREREPDLSWTELAHDCGYADQSHLTRDFRAFVRAAPSRFSGLGPAADLAAA